MQAAIAIRHSHVAWLQAGYRTYTAFRMHANWDMTNTRGLHRSASRCRVTDDRP